MSRDKNEDTEMTPAFGLPSDLDAQVHAAIEQQRSRGENFQHPTRLALSDILPLLNIIHSITGRAAIPSLTSDVAAGFELGEAYKAGHFESVTHKYFYEPTEDPARGGSGMVPSSSDDSLRSQFNVDYQGKHPEMFIKQLQLYRDQHTSGPHTQEAYSWSITIVQSSGMGKSRMIHEVSRTIFVISINLREALPDGIETYPPADHDVRRYFEAGAQATDQNIQVRCAVFLAKLFQLVRDVIRSWKERGPDLASKWSDYLAKGESTKGVGPDRLKLYQEVVKQSKKELKRLLKKPNANSKAVQQLKNECQNLTSLIAHGQSPQSKTQNVFYVAFDEAHTLTKPRDNEESDPQKSRTVYSNLEGALKHLRDAYVFFIFLSTNSHLHRLAPPINTHPSARHIIQDGRVLLTPWTELPFDVFAQQTVDSSEPITLEKISSIDFMVGFGRPLWYTYHQAQVTEEQPADQPDQPDDSGDPNNPNNPNNPNDSDDSDRPDVLRMARSKLAPVGAKESECFLAAIGVRVGLTFDASSTPARELESRMVEQHMRVALAVPSHREFMRTSAPSEPVLAEVAGRACVLKQHAAKTLQHYFGRGMLARGERGEVVGRLLLTLAHDDVEVPRATTSPLETQYHKPIPLIDLLKALFHKCLHQTILGAKPTGNPEGAPLQEAFKNAYVHFSHFGIANDAAVLDVKNMHKCLARGMALQPTAAQCNIDAVIPVHLGPITSPISEETTTSINLRFNHREDPWPCFVDHTVIVPNGNVPSLSLILELGATRAERVAEHGVGRSHEAVPPGAYWDDKHYEIVAYGHDAETYAVIPEGEEAIYSDILAASELDTEYPRSKDDEMVKALEQMMPEVGQQGLFWPES